ncbi:Rv3654c family TadE-like protein [Nocardioides sp. Soil805]|uniref:Rv3654c family TadE-like protein n=1 Tax=Nocardioides sp. Soil805 TaxID=1736416 RepID=UPI000702CB25|nr:Rv3654c family TadE-like protein [Nocardioides sp. Soil805]KRF37288.1 hypothetical protein ASG94_08110 [Nocardioides sp. Soil805]
MRGHALRRSRQPAAERGAATLLVVAAAGLLLFLGLALGGVSALVVAQRRVQSAADLSALAGATAAVEGGDACAAAAGTARANGADLVGCVRSGDSVRVAVTVPGVAVPGGSRDVTAEARAGPAP